MRRRASIEMSFFSILRPVLVTGPDRSLLHGRGGTVVLATVPCRRLARLRTSQPRPSCTPNTLDGIGTRKAASGRSSACRLVRPLSLKYEEFSALVASFYQLLDGLFDLGEGGVECGSPRVEHNIPLRIEFTTVQSKRLSKSTFDSIADHCATDRFRHRKPKPRPHRRFALLGAGEAERREQAGGEASAVVINQPENGRLQDSGRLREPFPCGRFNRRGRSVRFFRR